MTSWCILRTSSSKTLPLAHSLAEAGFEVWTPVTLEERRVGLHRTRQDVPAPLVPSFVFARADRVHELLALSHSPSLTHQVWDAVLRKFVTKGFPFFRLFRGGNHRFIPDADLSALRRAERLPRPLREERVYTPGDRVRTEDGGFAGLCGTVVSVNGKWVTVAFPRWDIAPEFASWLLRPDIDDPDKVHVSSPQSE